MIDSFPLQFWNSHHSTLNTCMNETFPNSLSKSKHVFHSLTGRGFIYVMLWTELCPPTQSCMLKYSMQDKGSKRVFGLETQAFIKETLFFLLEKTMKILLALLCNIKIQHDSKSFTHQKEKSQNPTLSSTLTLEFYGPE